MKLAPIIRRYFVPVVVLFFCLLVCLFFTIIPFYKCDFQNLLLFSNLLMKVTDRFLCGSQKTWLCYHHRMPPIPRVTCIIKSTHHIRHVFKSPNSLFAIDFWSLLLTYETQHGLCPFRKTIQNSPVGLHEWSWLCELLLSLVSLWLPPGLFYLLLLLPSELIDWGD